MVQALHQFSVPFHFPVFFTRNAWHPENRIFVDTIARLEPERRHRVLVIIDNHVVSTNRTLVSDIERYFAAHADRLSLATAPVVAVGGEASKNDISHTLFVLKHVNDFGIDRQSFVVVVGGGAVLDMASFAAAIAHRWHSGRAHPDDGALAGRLGNRREERRSTCSARKTSSARSCRRSRSSTTPRFLETLDRRDRIAGIVEAVKVALFGRDVLPWHRRERAARSPPARAAFGAMLMRAALNCTCAHICGNGDPFELGSARPLDFGHWAAHKLESMTQHRLRHGEAVAIGIALDARVLGGDGTCSRRGRRDDRIARCSNGSASDCGTTRSTRGTPKAGR